jgi:hypothetical protein
MVQGLDRSLSPSAQSAAADGIERIAFDFLNRGHALANLFAFVGGDSLAFHDARQRSASRAASGADCRVPLFLSGYELVLRDQQRH